MVPRYRLTIRERESIRVMVLADDAAECEAELVPDIGSHLIRFASRQTDIVSTPPSLAAMQQEPFAAYRYGTPLLFPPNRVNNAVFTFRDRTYRLPANEPPHHLHGEISRRPWNVTDSGVDEDEGAYVTTQFRYGDHPDLMDSFPHPLVFTCTHRLKDGRLEQAIAITNTGDDEAPFGFGVHPYFSIPFGTGERIELQVPALMEWPVTSQAFVTGLPEETDFVRRVQAGASLGDFPPLGVSLLSLGEGWQACRIMLADRNLTIHYSFNGFPYLVLFRPDWSEAFSLEPYTCVTDAFNLPYDRQLTGMRGIAPGETVTLMTRLGVEWSNQSE